MSEWWSYALSDFLLFSPRVYYRLMELHNRELWPVHLLAWAAGAVALWQMLRPRPPGNRLMLALLGLAWLWVAWGFVWERYATINWAAAYVVPALALQGLLLIGCAGAPVVVRRDRGAAALLALVLVGYPLLAPSLGRGWAAAESFAIMPDPTAAGTLAVLAALRTPWRGALMIIPALWCAVTGVTLSAMAAPDFFVAPLAAAAAIGLALRRRSEVTGPPPAA